MFNEVGGVYYGTSGYRERHVTAFRPINGARCVCRWTGDVRYMTPAEDAVQNMENAAVTYDDGTLTLTFQRARNTTDDKDWAFTDTDCLYFIFPVGGGPHTIRGISKHIDTPIISSRKICISK